MCRVVPLTSPRASDVIIFCKSTSFRVKASSSSAIRSASSSLIASSSLESASSSPEDDGEVGLINGVKGFLGACNVIIDDEVDDFLCLDVEIFEREFSLALTSSGVPLDNLRTAALLCSLVVGEVGGLVSIVTGNCCC